MKTAIQQSRKWKKGQVQAGNKIGKDGFRDREERVCQNGTPVREQEVMLSDRIHVSNGQLSSLNHPLQIGD